MKRALSLILALLMALSLAACGSSDKPVQQTAAATNSGFGVEDITDVPKSDVEIDPDSIVSTKKSISFNIPTDPGRIGLGNNASAITVNKNIYEPLWMRDGDGVMQYRVMEEWEVVDDLTYIVHVRPGVYCSDGHELKAEDIAYSINWACEQGSTLKNTTCIDIPNLEVIDEYSLKMPLLRKTVAIENELQDWVFTWEGAVEASPRSPAGAGPYMLKEWVEGTYLTLVKNPYYSFEEPYIDEVKMVIVSEDAQKINALITGEIDYLYQVPGSEIDYIKTLDDFEIYAYPSFMSQMLIYNCTDNSVLSNKDARKAVSYAVDSETILNLVYNGYGSVSTSPLNSSLVTRTDNWAQDDYYRYDLDKAKAALDASGIDWSKETLVIATNGTEPHTTTAQIIQNTLGQLGVTAEIQNFEASTFNASVMRNTEVGWDICLVGAQIGSGNGAQLMDNWFSLRGFNASGWSNQEFTDLLVDALADWDSCGVENQDKALQMLIDECPIYSYIQMVNVDAKVKNMVIDLQAEQTILATGFKRVSRIFYD